ncbi:hypothetical protein [Streptomyces sp. NPDC003077]|uniref:hypothetical protein n=1 Tax=Streptomyces sp. NPDC003077 TaxID=3154443 RepID=UPI0033BEC823
MRKLTSVSVVVSAALTAGMVAAAPASAGGYRCSSSTRELDTPQYDGPWPDNWRVTTTLCAKRSKGRVYAYARVRWDGPNGALGGGFTNDAYFLVRIRAAGKVKASKRFHGIESRWDHSDSNGNYNGSYRTGTVSWKGRTAAVAAGSLNLEWADDGKGFRSTSFTSSPRV